MFDICCLLTQCYVFWRHFRNFANRQNQELQIKALLDYFQ